MTVDANPLGKSQPLPIDSTGTIALYRLPGGSIERAFDTTVLIDPDESFDYRVDVGVLPEGTDEPDVEDDIQWFQGAIEKSKSDSSDERDNIRATSTYVRIVITTAAATAGSEARTALTVGRK